MKRKWNWIDTVITCIIVLIIGAVCYFFFGKNATKVLTQTDGELLITVDTPKDKVGTYDSLKSGQELYFADNEDSAGVIEKVEIIPYRTAVFNESTKQYAVNYNDKYPICRVTIKVDGYINDKGEAVAAGRPAAFDTEWNLETKEFRFSGTINGIEEVSDGE